MNDRIDELTAAIRNLGFAQRVAADEWVRATGLTRPQAFSLGYIAEHQDRGVIARELAEMSGTTPASVTSLIHGLEERGLVQRTPSPTDSRVKFLRATPEGAGLVEGFDDAMHAAQERIFAPLSPDEQDLLLSLLRRVMAHIDAPEPHHRRRDVPR
ncbi:MAG: MarR family transcriptional regulator [Arachnia sp.]